MSEEERKTREDFDTESEWYTYLITHPEEEEEVEEEKYILYYKCTNPKCNYVMKTDFEVNESDINEFIDLINTLKCPKCGGTGFILIGKEEYEKLLPLNPKKSIIKKDKDEYNKLIKRAYEAKEYIMDEREELFEDLNSKLIHKEITEKRFVYLFYNLSFAILMRASKKFHLPMVAFRKQKKNIFRMCDEAIDLFKIKEETDEILDTYDAKEDEIYDIYYSKYLEYDDENKDNNKEIDKLLLEYKRASSLNQYNKRLEEKYGEKLNDRMKKKSDKRVYRLDKEFEKSVYLDMKNSIVKEG